MERRRAALDGAMAAREVAHVLLFGANRFVSAIGWLTRWPVTQTLRRRRAPAFVFARYSSAIHAHPLARGKQGSQPAGALLIGAVALREGRDAWHGDSCGCC
jgi:hypothetical protein